MTVTPAAPFSLHFGTGGIRARMGEGPDRLNAGTVAVATQGLADWLLAREGQPSVVVARDCREHGEEFVRVVAEVLAGNGVALTGIGVAPTPMLSFAVRELGASVGLVLTASHNARDYNGYKVYGPDGCQATTRICREVAEAIGAVARVRTAPAAAAPAPEGLRQRYLDALAAAAPGSAVAAPCAGLRVAYSPLNGTGWDLVPEVQRAEGAEVLVVPEQAGLDGAFPTCPYPNPEDPDAMRLVGALADAEACDLALATDPDADRVGVLVRHGGEMVRLSGDEVGELLLDWACRLGEEAGSPVAGRVVVSTIVTSAALDAICSLHGLRLRRTLTGFKYVGEQVGALEEEGRAGDFLLGVEESLGYLSGSYVRDKDGVQGCLMVARMAAWHAARGRDLVGALADLRAEVGWNLKSQVSVSFEDAGDMGELMGRLRGSAPAEVAGLPVASTTDYAAGAPMPGDPTQTLPPADVLQWDLVGGSRLIVRPSGTEPKLKLYCFAHGEDEASARETLSALERAAAELVR